MILGIYGSSGLGREVNIIARKINAIEHKWEKIIYVDDNESITDVLGVPSYTFVKAQELFPNLEVSIAIGEPKTRELVYNKVKNAGIKLANLIHPGVYIDDYNIVCCFRRQCLYSTTCSYWTRHPHRQTFSGGI